MWELWQLAILVSFESLLIHTNMGSMITDREPTDRKQTYRRQRRLAEKGDPKYVFTIPKAILPKPSLCDEITVTKSSLHGQFVCGQFVAVS